MLDILKDRTYRHLFLAQVVALLGAGLATVALGLLAYDLAEDDAAMVLGAVFFIKMVAYVGIAPLAGAFADRVNRRAFLVALDRGRAGGGALPALRDRGLAGLCSDLPAASGLGRVHPDLSGHDPRCPAG